MILLLTDLDECFVAVWALYKHSLNKKQAQIFYEKQLTEETFSLCKISLRLTLKDHIDAQDIDDPLVHATLLNAAIKLQPQIYE